MLQKNSSSLYRKEAFLLQGWKSPKREEGYSRISVHPIGGALGAEVRGVDLSAPLDQETWREIKRAFAENLVIFFRGQTGFTREKHLEFAQQFGPLQNIKQLHCVEGYPNIQIIERQPHETVRVIGSEFHQDSTFLKTPPTTTTTHAIVVPEYGGDTAFTNLYLAYETLSEKMQEWLRSLTLVHSATDVFGTKGDPTNFGPMVKPVNPDDADAEVRHPLICTHAVSRRKHLFFNKDFAQRIVGLSYRESQMLFDFLAEHASNIGFTARVRWEKNMVLIWDNRCTYHCAVGDFQGKHRYMERVTTGGEIPFQ